MNAKSIFASKTFWANVTALVAAVSAYATGSADMSTAVVGGVMALVNIVLRFVTTQPVAVTPDAPTP